MRPERATLVDLLDRLLERGVVLEADVLITVAGVPLVALCLRAAIAGVDVMLRHGVMGDWLARAVASASVPPPLAQAAGEARPPPSGTSPPVGAEAEP
jgi:hypothetical protein